MQLEQQQQAAFSTMQIVERCLSTRPYNFEPRSLHAVITQCVLARERILALQATTVLRAEFHLKHTERAVVR